MNIYSKKTDVPTLVSALLLVRPTVAGFIEGVHTTRKVVFDPCKAFDVVAVGGTETFLDRHRGDSYRQDVVHKHHSTDNS